MIGEALARHLACIGDLSAEDQAVVTALGGETRHLKRNEDILRSGEHPTHVVIVLSGFLYRYTIGPDGARQIHSFYMPPEAPCLETLYLDVMDNNLAATTDSRIGLIPHPDIYRVIDEHPGVRKLLWRQTLVQAAIFREWLMRNSKLPAHAALAHFFCEILTRAKAAGIADGDSCRLPITQEMLADAVGMTTVHTNRTMMLLRDTGAVEWRNGRLQVRDWEKLRDACDYDPYYLHLHCDTNG
ncbi:MAG TPA: Crp/Fnr family transcriptional regulator [Allosphingosinicella sp.]|nr:Crp/Fnr family transcriptional regulator [Allosphingosinicella sp.]